MADFVSKFSVKTSHYILAGFGVVAALNWNNAIKETVEAIAPSPKGKITANVIYAVVMTLILILLIHLLPETKTELPIGTQCKIKEQKNRDLRELLTSSRRARLLYI